MQYIRNLENLTQHDVTSAGGKGANLGALVQAGQPVPPGFVLLTCAYQHFIESNGIQGEIERLLASVSSSEPSSSQQTSDAIRALFERGNISDEIAQAILNAYRQLGTNAVAVRSSATAEDLPSASFAGQQETYLNVRGETALLEAVRRCWSSLWTARAIAYRIRQSISPRQIGLAVIVQQMVAADASGILFTINPITGDASEILINAAWGLGEAIVSGRVTPDTITVDKATGAVKHIEIGDKTIMTALTQQGVAEITVEEPKRTKAVLTPTQTAELTHLGREIENLFGSPQDIEWALADGKISILQARPVTTRGIVGAGLAPALVTPIVAIPASSTSAPIPPGDDSWDSDSNLPSQPFDLWTRTNVGENLPFPISPLTATAFPAVFKLDAQPSNATETPTQATRRFYGRLYLNEGAILHNLAQEYGLPASFMNSVWNSSRWAKQLPPGKFRPLRLLRKLPTLLRQGFSATRPKGPKQTPMQFFAQIDQWVNDFLQKDLNSLDDQALWAEGLPAWRERGAGVFATNIRVSTPAGLSYSLLERLVGWWTGRSKEPAHDLVTGLSGIYSAEVGPALWHMAQTLHTLDLSTDVLDHLPVEALALLRNTPEAQPFIEQFNAFLQRQGHRCPNEVELLNPRWIEAPEQVIELLANYLRAGESIDPIAAEQRQRQRRLDATTSVEAKLDPIRRAIFRSVLRWAQKAMPIRDNSRYFVTKFLLPTREVFASLGQRWAERGWLSQADDIFFLTLTEVRSIVEAGGPSVISQDLHTLVTNRRAAYDYWMTVAPPAAFGPDGQPLVEEEEDTRTLKGAAVSGGKVRGIARIVLDPREAAKLRAGEILVTQATDPGWTPVFPLVSGLVLEIGGQLSHGAILAREYGLPAVINVPGATRYIRDGQTIVVDGTNGIVYLEQSS